VDTVELTAYGAVVVLQRTFSTRAKVREALAKVLATAPQPQTIIGCEGRDESRPSILYMANRHPFRLLDLSDAQWPMLLRQALSDARLWYGKSEIFEADLDALRRIHITLPEVLATAWEDFDEHDLITLDEDDAEVSRS